MFEKDTGKNDEEPQKSSCKYGRVCVLQVNLWLYECVQIVHRIKSNKKKTKRKELRTKMNATNRI